MTLSTFQAELLFGSELHQRVILEGMLKAERFVWMATANLKDMHIKKAGRFRPILEVLEELALRGISFRIVHGELPSRPFRQTLERLGALSSGALELQICPRSHWKILIVDGLKAYMGSANFTGAGLGAKSEKRRNLELGLWSQDPAFVKEIQRIFDQFWIGEQCRDCGLSRQCPDPIGET
jgi:phosphatidylserine/phosphatidylglycerophosphate/cardiolipin synthase-like enzyme